MASIGDLEIRINGALVEEIKRLAVENEALRADVDLWKHGNESALTTINRLGIEMERLRSENAELRNQLTDVKKEIETLVEDIDFAIDAARNHSEPVQNKPPEE